MEMKVSNGIVRRGDYILWSRGDKSYPPIETVGFGRSKIRLGFVAAVKKNTAFTWRSDTIYICVKPFLRWEKNTAINTKELEVACPKYYPIFGKGIRLEVANNIVKIDSFDPFLGEIVFKINQD